MDVTKQRRSTVQQVNSQDEKKEIRKETHTVPMANACALRVTFAYLSSSFLQKKKKRKNQNM
jgi:hypothetical protein